MNSRALVAEAVGTFALVSAVCGAALFSAPSAGLIAVALAVGMTVLAMAFALGHVSGGHFNPAVTIGLVAAERFDKAKALPYIAAQCVGGVAAALVFGVISAGALGGKWNDFVAISNTYGGANQFSMVSVFLIEFVISALFLVVITGATSAKAPAGFAPIAIGLALAVFHLMSIPVSNASLNPARSLATAVLGGWGPLSQLWLFIVAPIAGGAVGGYLGSYLQDSK